MTTTARIHPDVEEEDDEQGRNFVAVVRWQSVVAFGGSAAGGLAGDMQFDGLRSLGVWFPVSWGDVLAERVMWCTKTKIVYGLVISLY